MSLTEIAGLDLFQLDAFGKQMQLDAKVAELQGKGVSADVFAVTIDFLTEELYPPMQEP